MNLIEQKLVINRTKQWIIDVVIDCNFCPFAAKEMKKGSIHYEILNESTPEIILEAVMNALLLLDKDEEIETSLLILACGFENFEEYLDLADLANELLVEHDYEGIYQIASFHPQYLFEGSTNEDPSNYTNRSPYPMLHFLREESVSKAVKSYPNIEEVPNRNVAFTKEKGLQCMIQLLGSN